jgi:hypothetical protein
MPTQGNAQTNAAIVTLTTTAETAVVTTQPVTYNSPGGSGNAIEGNIVAALSAAATSVVIKAYQGATIGGTLVATSGNINVTASTTADLGFSFEDTSAAAKGSGTPLQYTISLTVIGATGNTTIAAGLAFVNVTPVTAAS